MQKVLIGMYAHSDEDVLKQSLSALGKMFNGQDFITSVLMPLAAAEFHLVVPVTSDEEERAAISSFTSILDPILEATGSSYEIECMRVTELEREAYISSANGDILHANALNILRLSAIEKQASLFVVRDSVVVQESTLGHLLMQKLPIVGAITSTVAGFNVMNFTSGGDISHAGTESILNTGIVECGATGGCTLIDLSVLLAEARYESGQYSAEIAFCAQAVERGFTVHVSTNHQVEMV